MNQNSTTGGANRAPKITRLNINREIDFERLQKGASEFAKHSTLNEAELITSAVPALMAWERCGGREYAAFHNLLDSVEQAIS